MAKALWAARAEAMTLPRAKRRSSTSCSAAISYVVILVLQFLHFLRLRTVGFSLTVADLLSITSILKAHAGHLKPSAIDMDYSSCLKISKCSCSGINFFPFQALVDLIAAEPQFLQRMTS